MATIFFLPVVGRGAWKMGAVFVVPMFVVFLFTVSFAQSAFFDLHKVVAKARRKQNCSTQSMGESCHA